ncbi:MAG: hypothetical protein Q9213_002520 [Squamulea squamosa]
MPVYDYKFANPVGFGQSPPIYTQASATGHQLPLQNPPRAPSQRRQIIVTNLYVGVNENRLKEFFQDSVGLVQECRVEERGDKKRHALVSFTHAEHAQLAINRFNEKMIFGRKVNVRFTKEDREGPVIIDGSGLPPAENESRDDIREPSRTQLSEYLESHTPSAKPAAVSP